LYNTQFSHKPKIIVEKLKKKSFLRGLLHAGIQATILKVKNRKKNQLRSQYQYQQLILKEENIPEI
jgi:hypothetical protein